jgi:spore coat protein CotF
MYWVQEKPTAEVVENLKKRHGVEGELWLDVYSGVQLTFKKNQLKEYSIATTETF